MRIVVEMMCPKGGVGGVGACDSFQWGLWQLAEVCVWGQD